MVEIPVSRQSFRRAVRALDEADLAAFAADLYAARGWTAEADDGAVELRRDGAERRVVVVPAGRFGRSATASITQPGVDVVVAPGEVSPGDHALADDHGVELVDAGTLYERLHYGIDPGTAADLLERHFDPAALEPPATGSGDGRSRRVPITAAVGLAGLLVAGFVVASVVGLGGLPAPAAGPTTATGCPAPPDDVHPATLRPRIETVRDGLGGWTVRAFRNYTRGDPALRGAGFPPEIRFVAEYRLFSGQDVVYDLRIDRWGTADRARRAGAATAARWNVTIAWGAYTLAILRTGDTGGTPSPSTLLAAVEGADGRALGTDCVERFAVNDTVPPVDG